MRILVVNGGSSSFKCWLHDLNDPLPGEAPQPLWEARVEWSRDSGSARIRATGGESSCRAAGLVEALPTALRGAPGGIEAVGHRIVHGGKRYRDPLVVTPEVRAEIAKQAEFAPAHNRFELEAIETIDTVLGTGIPQIAVFDTAFHSTLEPAAYVYPGPYGWLNEGVRRYGFHGISYQYATRRAHQMLGGTADSLRLILCHLGNGASLAAVHGGRSMDTTMGFTPLEGVMMGTRSGSLDPGILIYQMRHCGYTADELDHILNRDSGLLGISGVSADMREILHAIANGNHRAQLAFDIYAHRVCREAGGMLAVLGGVDALVFTGGVGENCAPLRERVCRRFEFLGLTLDAAKNARPTLDTDITTADSRVRVLVIRAQEDWEIARECWRVVSTAVR